MNRDFETDLAVAVEEVTALAAPNIAPAVDECYDLRVTIIRHQRCSFWSATTLYYVGDVVMPVVPNGHRYVALCSGPSSASGPEWTTSRNSVVYEEDGITWREDGPDYANIFDIEWAIYDVWMHKAGQASSQTDATLAGGAAAGTFTVNCSQLFDHCILMASKYGPVKF